MCSERFVTYVSERTGSTPMRVQFFAGVIMLGMRFQAVILLAAAFASMFAQTGDLPLRMDRMRADLSFLCSRELAGRVSLQPGAAIAARFLATEYAKAGLKAPFRESYLQRFPVIEPHLNSAGSSMAIVRGEGTVAETFRAGPDFRGSTRRDVSTTAPMVFAGYGITAPEYEYDDYAGLDVKGAIVLIFGHEPQEADPKSIFLGRGFTRYAGIRHKVLNAERRGAVLVLLAAEPNGTHRSIFNTPTGTGGTLRGFAPSQGGEDVTVPVITISPRMCSALIRSLGVSAIDLQTQIDKHLKPASKAIPDMVLQVKLLNELTRRGMSQNVVGIVPGSDPASRDETILVTSHYDHLPNRGDAFYPGANDNASGTVAVTELGRMFAASAQRPKRTIAFVSFGSEEEGMLGSYYYADHPIGKTRAVLNLDMIARDEAHTPEREGKLSISAETQNEINLIGGVFSPDLRAAIDRANGQVGLRLSDKFDSDSSQNALFRCDHIPFLMKDIPAIWLFGGWHPGYHEPTDTIERLNFGKLEKVVRLAYWTVWDLANSETLPAFRSR